MSARLISRSPDLRKLQDEGYEIEIRHGYLLLHAVPYVTPKKEIARGILVTDLKINDEKALPPDNHQVWFSGEDPCNADGIPISGIGNSAGTQTLCEGLVVHRRFSNKPPEGYPNYHAKMTRYVEIISNQARAVDPMHAVSACTFKPIEATEEEPVFLYTDSAASRAGIAALSPKLAMKRIAIVGLGGTGSYVLDLVAKTHVLEIHLFDGDKFLQHNAFRAPGAPSLDILRKQPSKVAYYADVYSQMRRGIVPHELFIDDVTVSELAGFDFLFLCVDKPTVRKVVSDFLRGKETPFIDVGMELEHVEEGQSIIGACRVTLSTRDKHDHFSKHVSTADSNADDLYRGNIQVADLNALNAALAVVRWKKYCGFYQDLYKEHQTAYVINAHQLTRDETMGP